MKRKIIAGAVALLLGGTGALVVAAPASAHTPVVSVTCDAIAVEATAYDGNRPAVGAPTVEVTNPDYVPATPGSPAVGDPTVWVEVTNPDYVPEQAAMYAVETKWRHPIFSWSFQWSVDKPEWGWIDTGERRQGAELTPYVPAQGTPTITVEQPNPDYVPAVDPTPAVGEPTIEVANPDYVPASSTPNRVEVTVDGVLVHAADFGRSHSHTVPLAGTGHAYTVTVTAWNDPTGSRGWTRTFEGSTEPCHVVPTPGAVAFADHSCDTVGTLTIPATEGVAYMITTDQANGAEARIYPGDYYATDDRSATGEPFYGEATVTAYDAVTAEPLESWAFMFTNPGDCTVEPTPTDPEPTDPEPTEPEPVTPPTTTPADSAPAPLAASRAADADTDAAILAETGGVLSPLPAILAAAALGIVGVMFILMAAGHRRSARQ